MNLKRNVILNVFNFSCKEELMKIILNKSWNKKKLWCEQKKNKLKIMFVWYNTFVDVATQFLTHVLISFQKKSKNSEKH